MIDLHLHVLPAVDDGAPDLGAALEMCRMAVEDGCEALVATPHQRTSMWDNSDRRHLDAVRAELTAALATALDGELALYPGAEIRVDGEVLDELDDLLASGLEPLAESRYLLLEFDRRLPPPDPLELTHELIVSGWLPIYAHPEHIPFLAGDLAMVERLAGMGALFQITAGSLTGDVGRFRQEVCRRMIDQGLAHFVASDAHNTTSRPPGLSRAQHEITRRWGAETARRLTVDNPRAVVENRPLPS
ncbi:MAG TPA: CpsB/CapC family capsule biosynthesis tyrosine phosphatase [Thermoanaerobaculia bacterium]|nr:CpsB/CapC family capsule biosynthesis tyrosine phosphatase [Thermoanaerobaculia bacterium]